ncbi:DUOX [Lepeophtheirus salmonis]|uniref:NAD(P)H oxidase (H2O2-forming) n=1 Tax=Lepeophtheirus salmonis TaxID=72036 RepID=A0A7R8CDU1_LEPSM|nr:DUOX [Lepeophtheirus salmonis]CAF2783503.1 DUOX [Lepeophtheirus salmonis]
MNYKCLYSLGWIICFGIFVKGEDKNVPKFKIEKQRYDGWYNNMAHPNWGSVDSPLIRKTPPYYDDGVYMMPETNVPSPRSLSEAFMKYSADIEPQARGSVMNRTALLAFFGQVVSSEILMASQCKGRRFMPFYRASYDTSTGQSPNRPREQLNKMTSWIDGSFIYSSQEAWVSVMRSFVNGSFKTMNTSSNYPPYNLERVPLFNQPSPHILRSLSPERMFVLGDPRTNQNPAFLAFGILFYRMHNVLANRILEKHPKWSDEDIFQAARRWNIEHHRLRIFTGIHGDSLPEYSGYKVYLHPGISNVFQSAAFRYGHTLIPPGIYRRGDKCHFKPDKNGGAALRLCSTWWNAQGIMESTGDASTAVEDILRGLSSQISEKEDNILCSDVRNKLFGPMEFSRRDLAALNIMRGRDNGLPDYNTVRTYFGLPRVSNWSQINEEKYKKDPELFERLESLYGEDCLDHIDVYIGGMLESSYGPGPLFKAIIKEQFERLRDSDRFWFENTENKFFTTKEIEEIRQIKLSDVILNATSITPDQIQKNVFFWKDKDPCPQPEQLSPSKLSPCHVHEGYDAFQGSEIAYIYGLVFFLFFPIFCVMIAYGSVRYMRKQRRKAKNNRPYSYKNTGCYDRAVQYVDNLKTGPERYRARCWMRQGESCRLCILINQNESHWIGFLLQVSSHQDDDKSKPMILLKCEDKPDFVLEFESASYRKRFIDRIKGMAFNNGKVLKVAQIASHIYIGFWHQAREERKLHETRSEVEAVMRTALDRAEFASALGMKENDLFVNKMFRVVDKDKNGRISFQELLDTVTLFSSAGRVDEKLGLIFAMCDTSNNGFIEKEELREILTSLMELAKIEKVSDYDIQVVIESMFESAGCEHRDELSWEDFHRMMQDFKENFLSVGLDCKGVKQNFLDTSMNIARHEMETMVDDKGNRQHIFYLLVFFITNAYVFFERFLYYSFMSEHKDLRHIMGMGIAITRGAATSLSFSYSIMLLSVCRNLLTMLKDSPIHQYIPLDSHLQFHKICACTGLFFSRLNQQNILLASVLKYIWASDKRPDIPYLFFKTLTGLTGISLFSLASLIFVFSLPMVRRQAYNFFWNVHKLYILFYILNLLHGLQRLTSAPRFWIFFVGPAIVYAFDKIISIRCSFIELDILETELLPNDVIKINFYRPPNFVYRSGQWARVKCSAIGSREGPWTWRLRNYFDRDTIMSDDQELNDPSQEDQIQEEEEDHPKIRLMGAVRTTMLYVCENHFQKLSKRSLFTSLKASKSFWKTGYGILFEICSKET